MENAGRSLCCRPSCSVIGQWGGVQEITHHLGNSEAIRDGKEQGSMALGIRHGWT